MAWAERWRGLACSAGEAADHRMGCKQIVAEFESGDVRFRTQSDEDIHTAVERRLAELIGPLAGKLHTGRSRNDQVATDFRLWLLEALPGLDAALQELQTALVAAGRDAIWTCCCRATPISSRRSPSCSATGGCRTSGALQRDRERLQMPSARAAVLPLG